MKPATEKLKLSDAEQVNELYEWLKEKQLTAGQAIRLLSLTEQAIFSARSAEADKLMLQSSELYCSSKWTNANLYAFAYS